MSIENLSCDTIGSLDGGMARALIDHEIGLAVSDTEDRGDDGKERVVVINIRMKKMNDELVSVHAQCQAKLPARNSKSTVATSRHVMGEAKLLFQTGAPENPRQNTFPEMDRVSDDGEVQE